jgi:hypothetical protein
VRRSAHDSPGLRAPRRSDLRCSGSLSERVGCANPVTLLVGTRESVRREGRRDGGQAWRGCRARRLRVCRLVEQVGVRGVADAGCSGSCASRVSFLMCPFCVRAGAMQGNALLAASTGVSGQSAWGRRGLASVFVARSSSRGRPARGRRRSTSGVVTDPHGHPVSRTVRLEEETIEVD